MASTNKVLQAENIQVQRTSVGLKMLVSIVMGSKEGVGGGVREVEGRSDVMRFPVVGLR